MNNEWNSVPFEFLIVVLLLTVFSVEFLLTLDVTVVTSSSSANENETSLTGHGTRACRNTCKQQQDSNTVYSEAISENNTVTGHMR